MGNISLPEKTNTFIDWLNSELNSRGWTDYELAKRAKISPSVISRARIGSLPKYSACNSIASAMKIPLETVLRKAGLLPENATTNLDREIDEMSYLFQQLSPDDRKRVLSIARTFLPK